MFQEVGVNCLLCFSGYVWDPVLLLTRTRIRCEEEQKDQEGFWATQSLIKMTWPLREEDNALQNSNFDPLLQKESNFNNRGPMEWSSLQCRLYTCRIWLGSVLRKGSFCFCPWVLKSVWLSSLRYSAWHYISSQQHSAAHADWHLTV